MLTPNSIVSSLMASGADIARLKFAGAGHVIVSREFDVVSEREFEDSFSEHVSERTGWARNSFIVQAPKNLVPLPVPAGERDIGVETAPGEDFRGSVPAQFHIIVDGKPYQIVPHRLMIERHVNALVATHKISRGSPVSASDVEVKRVDQSLVEQDALTNAEQVTGMLAARTIPPGKVLTEQMLTRPPVVRRGDMASVVCEGDNFSISTRARVLDDGCEDEIVRVRLATRKTVKAVVIDSNTLHFVEQGD
jgi:flagella basal body P-ring formation protein FlgA